MTRRLQSHRVRASKAPGVTVPSEAAKGDTPSALPPRIIALTPASASTAYGALSSGAAVASDLLPWIGRGVFGSASLQLDALTPVWRGRAVAANEAIRDALSGSWSNAGRIEGAPLRQFVDLTRQELARTEDKTVREALEESYAEAVLASALATPVLRGWPLAGAAAAFAVAPDRPLDQRAAATSLAVARLAEARLGTRSAPAAFSDHCPGYGELKSSRHRLRFVEEMSDEYRFAADRLIVEAREGGGVPSTDLAARLGEALVSEGDEDSEALLTAEPLGPPRVLRSREVAVGGPSSPSGSGVNGLSHAIPRRFLDLWARHADPAGAVPLARLVFGGSWTREDIGYSDLVGRAWVTLLELSELALPGELLSALSAVYHAVAYDRRIVTSATEACDKVADDLRRARTLDDLAVALVLAAHATRLALIAAWHGSTDAQLVVASSLAAIALDAPADDAAPAVKEDAGDTDDPIIVAVMDDLDLLPLEEGASPGTSKSVDLAPLLPVPAPLETRGVAAVLAVAWAAIAAHGEPIADTTLGRSLELGPAPPATVKAIGHELEIAAKAASDIFDPELPLPIVEAMNFDMAERCSRDLSARFEAGGEAPQSNLGLIVALAQDLPPGERGRRLKDAAKPKVKQVAADPDSSLVVVTGIAEPKGHHHREIADVWKPLVGRAIPLAPTPDLGTVRVRLHTLAPHATEVIDRLLSFVGPSDTLRLPPVLLVGSPGCGKSRFAMALGELIGSKPTLISCAGTADAAFIGTSRHWSTTRASVPLQAVKTTGIANPMIVLDEIEKASRGSSNGNLVDGLLGFLEPSTASRLTDPMLEAQVNLSRVIYVATANSVDGIPAPLRDRFRVLKLLEPGTEHLDALLPSIVADLLARDEGRPAASGLETGDDAGDPPSILPTLDPIEREAIAAHWRGGSIRALARYVEAVLAARRAKPFLN